METLTKLRYGCGIIFFGLLTILLWIWFRNNFNANAAWFQQCIIFARLAGLLLAVSFLFLLLSMCHGNFFESLFTKPLLFKLHRFFGFFTAGLLLIHLGLMIPGKMGKHHITFAEFSQTGLWGSAVSLATALGLLFLLIIWIFSALMVQKKISMNFWRWTHYLTYPALLLLFFHQVFWGNDFQISLRLTTVWSLLFGLVFFTSIFYRILFSTKHMGMSK